MSHNADTIVHEWFELVWNQGQGSEIDRFLAADALVHGLKDPAGDDIRGPAGFKPLHDAFRQAFPDIRVDVEHCIRDGDTYAFRCVVTGTHLGDGLGIAATQRSVSFDGMGFVRVANGQIVEAWNTFDFHGLYAQLGQVP